MPKKVDWEEIKKDYLESASSMASLALKYGLSKRAIEKRASAEGWAALRKGVAIANPKTQLPKKTTPHSTRVRERAKEAGEEIDELRVVEDAILLLSASLYEANPGSLDKCAGSLAKMLELRRKLVPPTAVELAEQAIALGYTPDSFMQALADAWREQA